MPDATPLNYQEEFFQGMPMGAKPPKADRRNLMAVNYMETTKSPPRAYDYEAKKKTKFDNPYRGQRYGSCTISSQAEWLRRIEWVRRFGKDLYVPDDVVDQRYFRLSGGADDGLYELDAIKDFRTEGFKWPASKWVYRIDGFAYVVPTDLEQLKMAIWQFKVIKICVAVHANMYNAPAAERVLWDAGSRIVGYHSMICDGYDDDARDFLVPHTWVRPRQRMSYEYIMNACTESYTLIDAANVRVDPVLSKNFDMTKFTEDLEEVVALPESAA